MNERAIVIDPNTNEMYEAGECGLPKKGGDFLVSGGWVEKARFDFRNDVYPILTPLPEDSMWPTKLRLGHSMWGNAPDSIRQRITGGLCGNAWKHLVLVPPPEKTDRQMLEELLDAVDAYDWYERAETTEKIAESKRHLADRKDEQHGT